MALNIIMWRYIASIVVLYRTYDLLDNALDVEGAKDAKVRKSKERPRWLASSTASSGENDKGIRTVNAVA